jgi:hypothetical protein
LKSVTFFCNCFFTTLITYKLGLKPNEAGYLNNPGLKAGAMEDFNFLDFSPIIIRIHELFRICKSHLLIKWHDQNKYILI